jgi:ubiquinone/menaquinone biosynthesis C-methylase UbiE
MVLTRQAIGRTDWYPGGSWTPGRIESLTEQVRAVCESGGHSVLEVGAGTGWLVHSLRFFGLEVTTLDIEETMHPDYVGDVRHLPFTDKQFDVIVCCEVLEHLPFDQFPAALRELRRVARKRVILSLPDKRRRLGLGVCLGRLGWRLREFNIPRRRCARTVLPPDNQHCWEIGYRGTLGRDVVREIRAAGFTIDRQYRLPANEWHAFFILR